MLGIQFLTMTANQSKLGLQIRWNESMVEANSQKLLVAANESENADLYIPIDYKHVALAVAFDTHKGGFVSSLVQQQPAYTILPTLSIPPSP
jgi:hypothetical protein